MIKHAHTQAYSASLSVCILNVSYLRELPLSAFQHDRSNRKIYEIAFNYFLEFIINITHNLL